MEYKERLIKWVEGDYCGECVFREVDAHCADICKDGHFIYVDKELKDTPAPAKSETLTKREQNALACLQGYLACLLDYNGDKSIKNRVKTAFEYADEFLKQSAEGEK